MIYNAVVVLDFETGGADARVCDPIEIAAVVINLRNLELYKSPSGDVVYFRSLMRPTNFDALEDEALRVNGKTREELEDAPLPGQVWADFARFVRQWDVKGKNSGYCAPIAAGHNILGFDMVIVDRLCRQYDSNKCKLLRKDGKQGLFHDRQYFDTMQIAKDWFWWSKEPSGFSMKVLRDFFGMSHEGAHTALKDVMDTAYILIKFLGLTEEMGKRIKFKDCFGENPRRIGQ